MNRSTILLLCALFILTMLSGTQPLRASWVQDGVAICTAGGFQHDPWIVPDGAGGAILVWLDARNVTASVYYAQRVNAAGEVLWTIDGVPLCTALHNQENAQLVQDGAGGAIVAWQDSRNDGWDIYAQRIDSNGNLVWTSGGAAVCTSGAQQWTPRLVQDGAGGAIVVWCECVDNAGCRLRAQRLDAEGNSVWTPDGVLVSGVLTDNVAPRVVSDGAGGAIIAWDSDLGPDGYVHAQRIDSEGNALWTPDGVTISAASRQFDDVQLVRDGAGGAIAVWRDWGGGVGDTSYLHAQRFNASGQILWMPDGIVVCSANGPQNFPQLVEDGSGGAIAVWDDGRNGIDYDVYAQKIDGNGNLVWPSSGVVVCAAPNHQWYPRVTDDGAGGAIVAWEEVRGATEDIFAQRIHAGGALLWTPGGIKVCGAQGNQGGGVQLARDGSGGAICAWSDLRRPTNEDIYAQRIGANGDIPVATQLQSCAAVCSRGIITLTWTLSECGRDLEFRVLRADGPGGAFSELHAPCVSTGRLSFIFTDGDGEPGSTYRYRVEYRDAGSWSILFESDSLAIPALPLALFQNVPNPFNPSTTIDYYLPESCAVTLDVFDISGKRVARLASGDKSRGQHSAAWKGMDDDGKRLSSGVYIYRLTADRRTISKKMVLLR